MYTENIASKYMSQKWIELQGEINESPIITGDFNTPKLINPLGRKSVRTLLNLTVPPIN